MQNVQISTIDGGCGYRETLGADKNARLDAMAIAVAGPVNAETVDVTNNHWLFNKHDLLSRLSRGGFL